MLNPRANRLRHLDGLRGLAILLVISFHAFSRWPEYLNFVQYTQNIIPFKYGMHGVQLFFMISGYVIFMSLDNCKNFKEFIIKRWSRLFPAMFVCTILIFAYSLFLSNRPAGMPHLSDSIPGLIFVHPQLLNTIFGININSLEGAFWTLYIEVFFYLFAGLIYFIFGRRFFIPLLFLVLPFYIIGDRINSAKLEFFFTWTGIHSFGWFYIGSCFYAIKNNNDKKLILSISLATTLLLNLLSGYDLFKGNYDVGNILFLSFLVAIFIASFYSPAITELIERKFLIFFGAISYPLYLIHENLMIAISNKLISIFNTNKLMSALTLIPSILLVILISYVIAKFIEPYFTKNLRLFIEN